MNYILIGFLISVGWHVVKLIYEVVDEVLFERLHKAKWYYTVAKGKTEQISSKPKSPYSNMKIGFK